MEAVTKTLEVARSNIAERVKGMGGRRGPQVREGDLELAAEIRRLVDERPTYGYRRITTLLRRERSRDGVIVNHKRIYRLMKKHGLLLARHTGQRGPSAQPARLSLTQRLSTSHLPIRRVSGLTGATPSSRTCNGNWQSWAIRP